jgi:hypothetical protein
VTFIEDRKPVSSLGTTFLLVAAFVLGATGIGISRFQSGDAAPEPMKDALDVNDTGPARCFQSVVNEAERQARVGERDAQSKQQRFPFDPKDGVEALKVLREAEACYVAAGKIGDASRIHAEKNDWMQRLRSEFSSAQLRLRVAMGHDRCADVIATISELEAFLSPRDQSPYKQWLRRTRETFMRRLLNPNK